MASVSGSEVSDGPVLSLIGKKLRALKKKYNRILQLEESLAQGKPLNKEQEDLLKSKLSVSVLIDEYEKLRQPLASALQEELSRVSPPPPSVSPPRESSSDAEEPPKGNESDLEDLIKLLYFGCLFDVKSQSEFTSTLLTRTHERGCCLTYDYVTDDATDLLGENDLDMISALGGLLTSRPIYAGVSHKNALEGCIQRAKLWLQSSDEPIVPGASVSYSGLREKLNKIMALDYFTMTPEMKLPVDVAAAVGKYNSTMQAAEAAVVPAQDEHEHQLDDASHYQPKENEQEEFQASEGSIDRSSPPEETVKEDDTSAQVPSGDATTVLQDEEREADVEQNPRDSEHKEQQQYIPRRGYQNQRGGRGGGGGRRGYYPNGRGGRGGRGGGGGGGYQNGRGQGQQFQEQGFYPRNYYNTRGRGGGRSGGSAMYNNNHGASAAGHGGQVELRANS